MSKTVRVLSRLAFVAFIFACIFPAFSCAESLTQSFDHSLGVGTSAKSFEHRIDLPENWQAQGLAFTRRTLGLTGKLVIEREEFKANYYYVKVRLPKSWIGSVKGSLAVTLEATNVPPTSDVLSACSSLQVREPALNPDFTWAGAGKYTAITILDRGTGQNVWERVIPGATKCHHDEGSLQVGHRYVWAVKQSDETGRYSLEAQDAFRIGTRYEQCMSCYGSGWVRCTSCSGSGWIIVTGPNGQPTSQPCSWCHGSGRQPCTFCNGTGQVAVPVLIHE